MKALDSKKHLIDLLSPRYGPDEAASIARIVLEDAFGVRQHNLADSILDEAATIRLQIISQRLLSGEPVQYVLGTAQFFGLFFDVTPAVLIPRQETEELVAWVLEYIKKSSKPAPVVLDIGLGSGCIGITLKKKHPQLQLYGVEKSPEALAVARQNANRILGSDGWSFAQVDILHQETWIESMKPDIIVSNPPYIPEQEAQLMPEHVLQFEPGLALFVPDNDPLRFYRIIADYANKNLAEPGALFFECNEFNAVDVVTLLTNTGFSNVELRKDLSGADRMISAKR
jgi:release factor glutamine methyltransferase